MVDAVADFGQSLNQDTVAYIHYAGHGVELDGESLLLGVNFNARTKSNARRQGYPVDSITSIAANAGLGIVSIDACSTSRIQRIRCCEATCFKEVSDFS